MSLKFLEKENIFTITDHDHQAQILFLLNNIQTPSTQSRTQRSKIIIFFSPWRNHK